MRCKRYMVLFLINVSIPWCFSQDNEVSEFQLHIKHEHLHKYLKNGNEESQTRSKFPGADGINRTTEVPKTNSNTVLNCDVENEKCLSLVSHNSIQRDEEHETHETSHSRHRVRQTTQQQAQLSGALDKSGTPQQETTLGGNMLNVKIVDTNKNQGIPVNLASEYMPLCSEKDLECFKNNLLPNDMDMCVMPLTTCTNPRMWWVVDRNEVKSMKRLIARCKPKPCKKKEEVYLKVTSEMLKCVLKEDACKNEGGNIYFDIFGIAHCSQLVNIGSLLSFCPMPMP